MQSSCLDIQNILECAICNEILCNPRTLTCEHSFCKECIDRITQYKEELITVKCPLCGKEEVVEGDLSHFKAPLVLRQLLDIATRYCFFSSLSSCQEAAKLHLFLKLTLLQISP